MNAVRAPRTDDGGFVEPARLEGIVASRLMMGREALAWTLPEQIAVVLGDRILNEEIGPGIRIGEEALAREFEVSRGPIRDALRILEHVGLVHITNRRGAVASVLSAVDLREILEIRERMFGLALTGFARLATTDTIAQLRRHVATLEVAALEVRMATAYADAIDRVMLFLAHHCGNHRVGQVMTTLSLQSFRYFRRGYTRGPRAGDRRISALRFYRELAAVLEEGGSIDPLMARLRTLYAEGEHNVGDYLP